MYPLYIHNYFISVFSKGVSALWYCKFTFCQLLSFKFLSFVCNY